MSIIAKSTGALLPGRGLINPAFVIKIVPATDDLQQQPSVGRDNPNNDYLDNLKLGTEVEATVGDKKISGKVQRIIKNELGDGVYAIVVDSSGKTHKVEGSRISITRGNYLDNDAARAASSPGILAERRVLSFGDFSCR
jgi:hypothetical protein